MIRLGRISYVNMAPVFYRLDADVEEVQGVPTELNQRLLKIEPGRQLFGALASEGGKIFVQLGHRDGVLLEGLVDGHALAEIAEDCFQLFHAKSLHEEFHRQGCFVISKLQMEDILLPDIL